MSQQAVSPMYTQRNFFDPIPELGKVRAEQPVSKIRTPWGTEAWLVTRFDDVRAVLADGDAFDIDASSVGMIGIMQPGDGAAPGAPEGFTPEQLAAMAAQVEEQALTHAKIRRVLQPEFTPRRTLELTPRVEAHVEAHLDRLVAAGKPADLVEWVARPIPLLVICELLGIPAEEQAEFQRLNSFRLDTTADPAAQLAAVQQCHEHMATLVAQHRISPGEGVLGRLVGEHGAEFDDGTLVGLVDLLLLAGYESTSSMIALGTLLLLQNRDQLPLLLDDASVDVAVEEMLRYLTVAHTTMPRVALKDVTVDGATIAAGDIVLCSLPAANRDPDFTADPDRVDLARQFNSHVAFGHGMHRCFGAPLARIQMRVVFQRLFRRLPDLSLAIPVEDVQFRTAMISYGLTSLPVTW
jgi:cytochrome P450